jgi:hypothetical protein
MFVCGEVSDCYRLRASGWGSYSIFFEPRIVTYLRELEFGQGEMI